MGRARLATIPFPSGGLNKRDPEDGMDPLDCRRMDNILPKAGYGVVVPTFLGAGAVMDIAPIETLITMPFIGGQRLYGFANGDIKQITPSLTAVELKTGQTNNFWQHAIINDDLILVNGADQPQRIIATNTIIDSTYTGSGLTDNNLFDVTLYKNRLYFAEKNSTKIWYGNTGESEGNVTEFNLQGVLKFGGKIEWISSWTDSTGVGLQDFFVIMSNRGEILVYQGDDPGLNWSLAARFKVGNPLGRRSKQNIGADLWFMTADGVYSMSQILAKSSKIGSYIALSDKIRDEYQEFARSYVTDAVGWQIFHVEKENLVLICGTVGSDLRQYGINLETGAWCRLINCYSGYSWANFQGISYYGAAGGLLNIAFDYTFKLSTSTPEAYIDYSYTYLGARHAQKLVTMGRQIVTSIDIGAQEMEFAGALYVQSDISTDFGKTSGFVADSYQIVQLGAYEADQRDDWQSMSAFGYALAPMVFVFVPRGNCRLGNFQLMYETAEEVF